MQSRLQPLSAPKLDDVYAEALPNSRQLFARAQQIFPDGVTHDNRRMQPFPIYIERADGAYKWDVDGHRYIARRMIWPPPMLPSALATWQR
jgi:glutamate-1-semialdehyde aminotransferase